MSFSQAKVAFAMESELPWLALKDTPGFGGADIPGVYCKYFGRGDQGPWFYLVKHDAGVVVERHSHDGDVFHYILEGEWRIGTSSKRFGPGFMQFEQKGLNYGPLLSERGSLFLAIYDHAPNFIPAKGAAALDAPERDYEPGEG